jgi:hypothetical protein
MSVDKVLEILLQQLQCMSPEDSTVVESVSLEAEPLIAVELAVVVLPISALTETLSQIELLLLAAVEEVLTTRVMARIIRELVVDQLVEMAALQATTRHRRTTEKVALNLLEVWRELQMVVHHLEH